MMRFYTFKSSLIDKVLLIQTQQMSCAVTVTLPNIEKEVWVKLGEAVECVLAYIDKIRSIKLLEYI